MDKTHDDVGDLHAGVVNVVLDFDAVACGFQDALERVAEHGVSHVTDMCGFVGIDARVLDHLLRSIDILRACCRWTSEQGDQLLAIVEDIDVAGTRDLDTRYLEYVYELRLELFGDRARILFLTRG